jgi:NAD-dependent SIR2 family protein deacetylase
VNFGDMLHDEVCGGLQRAENESKECDVMLTLGSSLCVTPAASLLKHPKHLIICNLQKTDYDSMVSTNFGFVQSSNELTSSVKSERLLNAMCL